MKSLLKLLLSLFAKSLLIPIFVMLVIQRRFSSGEGCFAGCAQFVSLFPGTLGVYIRREYYKFTLSKCANNCHIGFGTIVSHPEAEIGNHVYIGAFCMIGTVTISDDVLIGSYVDILDGKEQHGISRVDIPIRLQERKIERVAIGRDCWLGNRSIVMANIGEGSVIGAGSVVVHDVEPYSVVVGNPARMVKKREGALFNSG